jgi:probable non-F420 flavinoid oxidoreductase
MGEAQDRGTGSAEPFPRRSISVVHGCREAEIRIGYHSSHEQFPPEQLLKLVQKAEAAGFEAAMSSEHFHPWSHRQGQSGFTLSWLGAAMQATSIPFGTLAVPGGWRYHPAIVAQAGATLSRMFPGRFAWMALGSGQALNEQITGERWPPKPERNRRLRAGAEIIRELWAGKTVTRAEPIRIEQATLFTRPEEAPLLIGAALTPETAEWLGSWADGLVTVYAGEKRLREMIEAFHRGGGKGKRLAVQVHLSWARDDAEAQRIALENWRFNIVPPAPAEELRTPSDFEAVTRTLRAEDLEGHIIMSADPSVYIDTLRQLEALGFDEAYLHHVGLEQDGFIEDFGRQVLPEYRA